MAKIQTIKPRLSTSLSRIKPLSTKDRRITGRALQSIRFSMWREDPHCAICHKITAHPYGYEIDHITPLDHGGSESKSNRQLLCADNGDIKGCHSTKTKDEATNG